MDARRRASVPSRTTGRASPHLDNPPGRVRGFGAGVAGPGEILPAYVSHCLGRLRRRVEEMGEVALDPYLRSTSVCVCVAIFSLNGASSSWGCEGLVSHPEMLSKGVPQLEAAGSRMEEEWSCLLWPSPGVCDAKTKGCNSVSDRERGTWSGGLRR